jgi:hypothetical protein
LKKHLDSSHADLHLCQPDQHKSCGWCCGLYNVGDASREALVRKLRARTEKFSETERTVSAIQDFSDKITRAEKSQLLDATFYSCEFVGFLDDDEVQVGCMLHPLAGENKSIDWRGLSFHGTMACQGLFCRSYRELSPAEKGVVLGTIRDWYVYGLVISDADYAKSFFRLAEERLGRQLDLPRLLVPPASKLVHEFFHWKVDWPYRNHDSNPKPCGASSVSSAKQAIHGHKSPALMDLMFGCLDSKFRSRADHRCAEQKVDQLFSCLDKLV